MPPLPAHSGRKAARAGWPGREPGKLPAIPAASATAFLRLGSDATLPGMTDTARRAARTGLSSSAPGSSFPLSPLSLTALSGVALLAGAISGCPQAPQGEVLMDPTTALTSACPAEGGSAAVAMPQFVRNLQTGEVGWFGPPAVTDGNGNSGCSLGRAPAPPRSPGAALRHVRRRNVALSGAAARRSSCARRSADEAGDVALQLLARSLTCASTPWQRG